MRAVTNTEQFVKDMGKLTDYTIGFLEGLELGKPALMAKLGADLVDRAKQFVDSNARVNPAALHHVYEWSMTGSPDARLFDIDYRVNGHGLSFGSTFRQSTSVKAGSNVPFYDKARIMEEGISVTIRPKTAQVLVFNDNGEEVFTTKPIRISRPGGSEVAGSFESVISSFFENYFQQSYLNSSKIFEDLKRPDAYTLNLRKGIRGGKSYGRLVGTRWISQAGDRV
tara:strand:+ start:5327 stop:6001 length:675 start_codon:yes stop_codon:yes gene_type:complete